MSDETLSWDDGLKRVQETTENLKREMSEQRICEACHEHYEPPVIAELQQQLAAANERITALEGALQLVVDDMRLADWMNLEPAVKSAVKATGISTRFDGESE